MQEIVSLSNSQCPQSVQPFNSQRHFVCYFHHCFFAATSHHMRKQPDISMNHIIIHKVSYELYIGCLSAPHSGLVLQVPNCGCYIIIILFIYIPKLREKSQSLVSVKGLIFFPCLPQGNSHMGWPRLVDWTHIFVSKARIFDKND